MKISYFSFLFVCLAADIFAGQVDVVGADIKSKGDNQYRFEVTLQHKDTGWQHYANRWEILDTGGNILATRTLHHPHVEEQPFTRSLTATLPEHVKTIIIRGHDSVHQYDGREMKVSLP